MAGPEGCLKRQMPNQPPLQSTITKLLATAERCRRLATWIVDRQTCESLRALAEESELRAAELTSPRLSSISIGTDC
jgi:hypothetical protein